MLSGMLHADILQPVETERIVLVFKGVEKVKCIRAVRVSKSTRFFEVWQEKDIVELRYPLAAFPQG